MTSDSLISNPSTTYRYDQALLSWIKDKSVNGLNALKREDTFNGTQSAIDYVDGRQIPQRSTGAISTFTDNKMRKILMEVSSALTDVRPTWNYTTFEKSGEMQHQADVLNKLSKAWWRNSRADKKLGSATAYSGVGGSGYMLLTFNADLPGGGDMELTVYDPRDVMPIDPVYGESLQEWRGIVLKRALPVETIRSMYPSKAAYLVADTTTSWFGGENRRASSKNYGSFTSVWQVLRGRMATAGERQSGMIDLMTCYFKDESIHTGDEPRVMGDPTKNWSYTVYPVGSIHPQTGQIVSENEAKLYPRGRLVICTPTCVLLDIPNPHWHGLFPVIRITLDPLPWSLLGASFIQDLIPLQNTLNEVMRGAEDGIMQWVHRAVVADKNAISKTNLDSIDTRRAGGRFHLNPSAGQGFTVVDGPMLPEWYIQMPQFLKMEMEENSGVRGLQQLAQLKQMPAADTVDKYMEAMSPLLKRRARSLEISLSELAEMLKVCFYQYYDAPKRFQILGKDGLTLEDFDYDPNTMIPAETPGDTREERAKNHYRNFTFQVAPGSFLDVSNATRKLMMLQLYGKQALDIYTLWDAFDLPNVGPLPSETIPERIVASRKLGLQPGPTPEIVAAMEKAQYWQATAMANQMQAQAMMGAMGPTMGPGGPGQPPGPGGPPGGGVPPPSFPPNPEGRPASNQSLPTLVSKDGGSRGVVSTSGR